MSELFKNLPAPSAAKDGEPVSAPVVPVAPKEGEAPAEQNKDAVTPAQPTTNPAQNAQIIAAENPPQTGSDDDEVEAPPADGLPQMDELQALKNRANLMGINYSNNIGVEALRKKIDDKLASEETSDDNEDESEAEPENEGSNVSGEDPETAVLRTNGTEPQAKMTLRQHLYNESMKLVRLRITNLDPKKKDLPGEIFTVGNEYIGTVKKFIPFGEVTDNGYHVPYVLYEELKNRKFLNVRTRKGKNGTPIVESGWANEFALEVLPPLTEAELARLSAVQLARDGVE